MSLLLVMRDISGNHLHKIYHTPRRNPHFFLPNVQVWHGGHSISCEATMADVATTGLFHSSMPHRFWLDMCASVTGRPHLLRLARRSTCARNSAWLIGATPRESISASLLSTSSSSGPSGTSVNPCSKSGGLLALGRRAPPPDRVQWPRGGAGLAGSASEALRPRGGESG
jgi:hypothetical protein